jgi:uncharacterized protein
MDGRELIFHNTLGKRFTLDDVQKDMLAFVVADMDRNYRIIIGSDSQHNFANTVFVTAIIIHRVGSQARFYYTKANGHHTMELSTRILQETADSVEILQMIENSEVFGLVGKENIEVHIDAGQGGRSRKIMDACISYVQGMGYHYKVKPDSYGATHVADRYTK